MASTRKTTNFNLSQFDDNDKPSWRGDYNGDMSRIDAGLNSNRVATEKNTSDIVQVRKDVDAANAKAQSAQSAADTANQGVAKANQDISALDSKVDSNAASATNSIAGLTRDISALKSGKEDKGVAYPKSESDAKYALKTDIPNIIKSDGLKKIALFGDSWLTVSNNALANAMKNDLRVDYIRNYAVNGALVQGITSQVNTASADSTDKTEITDVIIVAGTNNVYHDSAINSSEATEAFSSVRHLYPTANIHYFPNNSRTSNAGRNNRYFTIIQAAESARVSTHPELLSALMTGTAGDKTLGRLYSGLDSYGVQHLSDGGFEWLGKQIINVIDGGSFHPPIGSLTLPVTFQANSAVKFKSGATNTSLKLEYLDFYTVHVYGVIGELEWSGTPNPKSFTIAFSIPNGPTGVTCPVNISTQYTPLFLWSAVGVPDNIGVSTNATDTTVNFFGNAPGKSDGWTFSQVAIDTIYKAQYLV